MLLNSYEGFDYMDYSRYSMSTKDWGIVFIKSMAATVIIAYLFYDSPIVVIAFPAVFAYCAKLCRQEGVRRQKEKLNEEFMNVLKVLSSNMLAGYSVENAWQEAEKEMELNTLSTFINSSFSFSNDNRKNYIWKKPDDARYLAPH